MWWLHLCHLLSVGIIDDKTMAASPSPSVIVVDHLELNAIVNPFVVLLVHNNVNKHVEKTWIDLITNAYHKDLNIQGYQIMICKNRSRSEKKRQAVGRAP